MVHAFRFLDIQPPSYNQYMVLKESLGHHSDASLNMVHYAQLAVTHLPWRQIDSSINCIQTQVDLQDIGVL